MTFEEIYYAVPVILVLTVGIKVLWDTYNKEKEEAKIDRERSIEVVNNLVAVVDKLNEKTHSNDKEIRNDLNEIRDVLMKIYDEQHKK